MRPLALTLLVALAVAGCGTSSSSSSSSSGSSSASSTAALNHVHSIVIPPNNPNELYLGTHYHLYKSVNGGKTWSPLTKQMMLSMAMDMGRPSTIYAVSLQNGLLKTTDAGMHWTSIAGGIKKGAVTGVVVDPSGHVLLAYGNGIYRSVNEGAQWTKVLSGQSLDSAAFGGSSTAYAGSNGGLFVSQDAGLHWHRAATLKNLPVLQVATGGNTAYVASAVGLFRSTDSGKTWTLLTKAPVGVEFMGVAPSTPQEVIAEVGGKGFYASYDGGASWKHANAGVHDTNFNASVVRVAPSTPSVMYTGAWGLHFYASLDAGRRWREVSTLTK